MRLGQVIRRNQPRFGAERSGVLQQARLGGPMPWVIAIMVALTVMAAAAGLALDNLARNASAEIAGGVTVQIVEAAPGERARQAEVAVALLNNRDDVAEVRRVPDSELNELIEPWLGDAAGTGDEAIPVPALIDARLRGAVTGRRLADLRGALTASVLPADYAGWNHPFGNAGAFHFGSYYCRGQTRAWRATTARWESPVPWVYSGQSHWPGHWCPPGYFPAPPAFLHPGYCY